MKLSRQFGIVAIALSAATLASCSSKITDEQLRELTSLRDQERSMNSQIRQAEQDKSRLQGEVNSRRAELERCNQNKQFVQGKLATWPNVWPDWQDTPANSPTSATPRR